MKVYIIKIDGETRDTVIVTLSIPVKHCGFKLESMRSIVNIEELRLGEAKLTQDEA